MNVSGKGAVDKLKEEQNKPVRKVETVQSLLASPNLKGRFNDILGKKAAGFMSSIISVANSKSLIGAEPMTIVSAAVVAATLDLPINPNLGFAYIVPYNNKRKVNGKWESVKEASFQIGYKGTIQLAMRTGQYKTINATEVYKGDIKKINRFTGDIEFNEDNADTSEIVGYLAYFKLINGFEKFFYMTKEQVESHAKRYSQTYKSENEYVRSSSKWTTDFDAMALKTVLKLLLSKYGILSIEMQTAFAADQAVIKSGVVDGESIEDNVDYADNPENVHDVEFEETGTPAAEGDNPFADGGELNK